MNASKKKVVQYLGEAQGSEQALVRVLQSQIAMTRRKVGALWTRAAASTRGALRDCRRPARYPARVPSGVLERVHPRAVRAV
jgi:hypothetical protein